VVAAIVVVPTFVEVHHDRGHVWEPAGTPVTTRDDATILSCPIFSTIVIVASNVSIRPILLAYRKRRADGFDPVYFLDRK
jgi:hypothetical protein